MYICKYLFIYVCIYVSMQSWKLADSHRQMRITFGVLANHFGELIRNIFKLL